MKRKLVFVFLCAAAFGALLLLIRSIPRNEPRPASGPSPTPLQQRVNLLWAESGKARKDYEQAMIAARSEREMNAIRAKKNPHHFAGRFLKLAQEDPSDPAAVDALIGVINFDWSGDQGLEALRILTRDHLESDRLAPFCALLQNSTDGWNGASWFDQEKFLKEVIVRNPHPRVQAAARFALGMGLAEENPAEAEGYLSEVVANDSEIEVSVFGRDITIVATAKQKLFALRNLQSGKVAPEIEGEDIEGTTFRLSDYRGKVVVIDFFGDW